MIYREFKGKQLSALGMGCMRLPIIGEEQSKIDMDAVREMVAYAMEKGINYYDTAWGYHDGQSEIAIGKVLAEYPRESFYLASKFPGFSRENMEKVEEIFEKQLEKCGVEYFDFYMFHNLCENNVDGYLDPKYGILEYLLKQKENGRIRHLGVSTHGTLDTMRRFLDAYGEHMEFCQIQLNWLDWKLQNAKAKVDLLREYNLPIWVMEPVRGGKLVSLEEEYEKMLKEARPEASIVEWAFRFLQTISDVGMTLSGMSNFEQLRQNIATYETEKPLDEKETALILSVAQKMTEKDTLPCTACRYCTAYCPMQLDIPTLIELYNEFNYVKGAFVPRMVIRALPEEKRPSACLACRACEEVCPQNIKISEMMSDLTNRLEKTL